MILTADALRRFRRCTWAMIAACIALRMAAGLASLDPTAEPSPFKSACTLHSETLSC